jgi:alpha/beta hydrolase fold
VGGEHGQALWLAHVAGFDEGHTAEFEPLLGAMETPILIVWGEHDAWLDPEVSEQIERQLPHADRVLIPEAGHFSMEDRPERMGTALVDWLGEGDRTGTRRDSRKGVSHVRIVRAGAEPLTDIEPLWKALQEHHAAVAPTLGGHEARTPEDA